MTKPAVSYRERPVYMPGDGDELFAILTEPTTAPRGITVVLFPGGAWMPSMHRNQLYVRLARRIAELGYHTLRVDYHGVGESTGRVDYYDLARPHTNDVVAAVEFLAGLGHDRVVLAGSCFGGRSSVAAAARVDGLAGVALIGVPFRSHRGATQSLGWHFSQAFKRSTWSKIFDRGRFRQYVGIARAEVTKALPWRRKAGNAEAATPWFVDGLIKITERGVPQLLLYGAEGAHYQEFLAAREGRLGEVIDAAGDLVRVVVKDGEIHGLLTREVQQTTIDAMASWLAELE